ncbi:MAG: UvrD-helicase domain-containing protein [Bacteroidota bacterium]
MLEESPFLVYKSSAGSGKTYTLAKEYLKLALKSPFYFKSILAVTFTNKAADEMKERVLTFLENLAAGDTSELSAELEEHFSWTSAKLSEQAQIVLRNILHDYTGFAITTIDTFFNQVIRTFTREIGLQGGFEIEMDLENVLKEVVDQMLADLNGDSELKKWLVAFAKDRLQEGKSYEFRDDIKSLAYELFKEQYKSLESSLNGLEVEKDALKQLNDQLSQTISSFRNYLRQVGVKGLEIIESSTLDIKDFSRGTSGPAGQFIKWAKEDLKEPTKTTLDAVENVGKWFTKKSTVKEQIEDLADRELIPLLSDGVKYYEEHLIEFHTAAEVKKYLYTFGILNDLTIKIREYREEKEVILISDLPQFLRKIIDDSDTPYIYEKVGNRYQHFLIDEFQDTSAFQWSNFKPLVLNSLASGNFNMIVGDVKQSIYRWRGGNPDLLLNQASADVGTEMTREEMLSFNFRSFEEVIDFNNEIFQVTPLMLEEFLLTEVNHLPDELKAHALQRISFLVQSYQGVAQDKPEKTTVGGRVSVKFSAKPGRGEDMSWDDLAVQWAIEQIEETQQNGVPLRDIAILVRDSGQESKLVKAIGKHALSEDTNPNCSYQVISAQAMYLTNAAVVNFMIAVFKYLNNQKEQIALIEIINEFQRHILNNDPDLHELYNADMQHFLPLEFTKYVHTLGRFPLYELTEILIRIFKLERKSGELAYLQAFQDAILDYTKSEKGDLASFLTWWELKGRKRTVQFSDSLEAVKILTIHKSKGLQYNTVIIPFCHWNLDHNTIFSNILWSQDLQNAPYKDLPALPLRYSGNLKDSLFADDYFNEKIKAYHDNLNLLYVALTRAEQTLLIHGMQPGKSRKPGSFGNISDLLWDHLSNSPQFDEETDSYTVSGGEIKSVNNEKPSIEEVYLQDYISNKWRNKLTIRKQSGDYFDFGESARQLKVNIGVLTHQILSEIKYLDELKSSVRAAYMNMEITREDSEQLLVTINELFQNEQIAEWYSKKYEVRNEVVVLPKDGRVKRLDRVLIKDDQAIVIDFKTGKPISSDKHQVLGYIELLREMNYQDVSGYLVYLNIDRAQSEHKTEGPQIIQVG